METGADTGGGASGNRRVPKSLFVLLVGGLLAFGALVMLVRMPKNVDPSTSSEPLDPSSSSDDPVSAPLTGSRSTASVSRSNKRQSSSVGTSSTSGRQNAKGPLVDNICKSATCLKTAYSILDSMNTSVQPCQDFYEYACGGWVKKNPIPPQVSKWSPFGQLDIETNKLIQQILKEPIKSGDSKYLNMAKDFFKSCSDTAQLNKVGLRPIQMLLQDYGGWPLLSERWNSSSFSWMRSMSDLKRLFGTSAIFDIQVNQHHSNPGFSTVHLQQPSLFLSRPYFLNRAKYRSYLQAYKDLILNIARELMPPGSSQNARISQMADELIEFESQIALLSRDGVDIQYNLRNSTATLTLNYLQSIFDNYTRPNSENKVVMKTLLDFTFLTTGIRLGPTQLVSMSDTNYIGNIFELLSNTKVETLANYLHFRMLGWVVSGTTDKMRDHIHKYHRVVYGITEPSSREYVCATSTEEKFGLALAQPYLKKVGLDEDVVQQASELMEQVRMSFITLLDTAKWMNETVKSNLRRKARLISPCIGYAPWMSLKGNEYDQATLTDQLNTHFKRLDLKPSDIYLKKLWDVRTWLTDEKLRLLSQRYVPGCKWASFPGQIGAFYDIRRQAVNIPIGLLQPPFFYNGSPSAINYGGLGSILGHEFTHGFTVSGWTENDYGKFSPIGQCFVDQYNRFKVPEADMLYINGALTFDENFPDNGGLLEAFRTFKNYAPKVHQDQNLPGLERFSQDQLFFLGFANIWCSSSRRQGLVDQVLVDHHTPNRYRVIGTLQNSQEFATAWKCPVGSPMNPQKYKKCNAFQRP